MDYLENIPEGKRKDVIDICYDGICDIYYKFEEAARRWGLQLEGDQVERSSDPTWEDFSCVFEDASNLSKSIKDVVGNTKRTMVFPNRQKYGDKIEKEYQIWFDNLRKIKKELQKKDTPYTKKAYLPVISGFIQDFSNNNPHILKEEGKTFVDDEEEEERFQYFILDILQDIYSAEEMEEMAKESRKYEIKGTQSNKLYKKYPIKLIASRRAFNYISDKFDEIIFHNEKREMEADARKMLEKMKKEINQIKKVRKEKSIEEKTQEDIISEMHRHAFNKKPKTISQDERDLINMSLVRDAAKSVKEIDKTGFESLQELTGIDYQTLFHVINDERGLSDSEKGVYHSVTGTDY